MKPAWWSPWTWRRHGQTPWFLVLWGSSHLEDPARKGPTGFGKLSAFRGRLDPGWGLDAAFNGEFCKSGGKHREIKVDLRCKKKTQEMSRKCLVSPWGDWVILGFWLFFAGFWLESASSCSLDNDNGEFQENIGTGCGQSQRNHGIYGGFTSLQNWWKGE